MTVPMLMNQDQRIARVAQPVWHTAWLHTSGTRAASDGIMCP